MPFWAFYFCRCDEFGIRPRNNSCLGSTMSKRKRVITKFEC